MKATLILSLILLSQSAFSLMMRELGDVDGGGAELFPTQSPAWFVGENKIIRYCIETSSMNLSKEEISSVFKDALKTWSAYIEEKKINYNKEIKIATKYQEIDCDGTSDLKVFAGVMNLEILEYLQKYSGAVAFAQRLNFDRKRGWSKGFIWVAPHTFQGSKLVDWDRGNLKGAFLHELGHTLGNGHVEGTIMTRNIASYILAKQFAKEFKNSDFEYSIDGIKGVDEVTNFVNYRISKIDNIRELSIDFDKKFSFGFKQTGKTPAHQLINSFFGVSIKELEDSSVKVEADTEKITFDLQGKKFTGQLDKRSKASSRNENYQSFLREIEKVDGSEISIFTEGSLVDSPYSKIGYLKNNLGQKKTIILEYGLMSDQLHSKHGVHTMPVNQPFRLFLLEGGEKIDLHTSYYIPSSKLEK